MIPDSFKQDLLSRVDIVEVVTRYVQLKKAGANYLGLCPFHNEKTPSFTVSQTKQFYHCFGCGKHGNAIGFMMEYAGLGYIDALKDLAGLVGMQLPEWQPRSPEEAKRRERETDLAAVMEKAMDFYRAKLRETPRAVEYLKGRGLEGRIAARFGIGYAPDDWQGLKAAFPEYEDKALVECGLVIENEGKRYDRFRDRVMFPIFNLRNTVIGFGGRVIGEGEPKYLNSPETPLFEKGRELYGLPQAMDAIRAGGRVLVVEGYMDVVALAQFGVGYAVATLGTATTPVHVSKLLRYADELVFSFDGDAAGRKAAWRALEVSLALAPDHKPIKFLFLPQGEDPDTYVRKEGKESFERLVRDAQTLSQFLLGELRSQFDLATAEGRSAFLAAARPHVQKIAAPALRLQIVKEAARLADVTQEEVESLFGIAAKPSYRRPAPARPATKHFELEERVLTLVLAKPSTVLDIDLGMLRPDLEETKALAEIAEVMRSVPDPETLSDAMFVDRIEDVPHRELISKAQAKLTMSMRLSTDEALAELKETLKKIENRRPDEQKLLEAKILKGVATAEEKRVYQERFMDRG